MTDLSSGYRSLFFLAYICVSLVPKVGVDTNTNPNYASSDVLASYPSSPPSQIKHDVFVSFRGKDIRKGFLSHLTEAFSRKQIVAFVDNKLERGDQISQSLFGAIESSLISLVIFSPNYASSRWCLIELVKILEHKEKDGQIVIPIFYEVDPSYVRHQKGTYKDAFDQHEEKYSNITVQIWKSALNVCANLSGFHSSNFRNDAELIEGIIVWVTRRLKHIHQVESKGLVGINKPIAYVESLLLQGSEDVIIIGLWGMGGIGKTTIAEEVFHQVRSEYEASYFLANVREQSKRYGIIYLKNKIFSVLLDEKDLNIETPKALSYYVKKRLGRIKVLLVLDDVNDLEQLEILIGKHDWFGSGSRVIVKTRDKQVLTKVDYIYKVEALNFNESLQLFNLNALSQDKLEMEYHKLSERVVNYAKGVPLVLKVLGHLLHGKDKEIWKSQLEKLQKMPCKEVYDVMRLSYDDLDRQEREIFLDIACFFQGLDFPLYAIEILLKDGDHSVVAALERLRDKALIIIYEDEHHAQAEYKIVSMHDIIQEMAFEIIREESIRSPGSNIRLWDPDDVHEVLKNNKGIEGIRSISVNLSAIKELQLSPDVFAKMRKLQFLYFDSINDQHRSLFPRGLRSLPYELRYLHWPHYPFKSLPTKFSSEKLVGLHLPDSQLEKLWFGVKNLVNLRVISLDSSSHLMELPDFSEATNLEFMSLVSCWRLTSVHPSIFLLQKLKMLDLFDTSVTSLPSNIHLRFLHFLNLYGLSRLKGFLVISKSIIRFGLGNTNIFGQLSRLEFLDVAYSYIQSLPTMKHLTRLKYLDLSHLDLRTLPELPPSIERLYANGCNSLKVVLFPSTLSEQLKENKKVVSFWNCLNLDKHSLKAIGLNVQINIIKFAYQHLSAIETDYVDEDPEYDEDYIDDEGDGYRYDYDTQNNTKAAYVYPGSRVPEWLVYRSTLDYITIDLSFAPHPTQFGFIFCLVVPKVSSHGSVFKFSISDGKSKEDSINMYLKSPKEEIELDHVYLLYDHRCSHYLNSKAKIEPRFNISVTAVSIMSSSEYVPVMLKGIGVSPINNSDYHNFVQHIVLANSTISLNQRNWMIEQMGHTVENLVIDIVGGLLVSLLVRLYVNSIFYTDAEEEFHIQIGDRCLHFFFGHINIDHMDQFL